MNLERPTQKSQEALQAAQSIAARYGHVEMDGEHLLLALLEQLGAAQFPACRHLQQFVVWNTAP